MERRRDLAAARENEFLKRFQVFLAAIDYMLKLRHIAGRHRRHVLECLAWRGGENAADIEQFVLNPAQVLFELRRGG
jgi:hypothetical protein